MVVKKKVVKSVKNVKAKKPAVVKPESVESLTVEPVVAKVVEAQELTMKPDEVKPQQEETNTPSVRVEVEVEPETAASVAPVVSSVAPTVENVGQTTPSETTPEMVPVPGQDFAPVAGGVEYSTKPSGMWKKWLMILVIVALVGSLFVGGVMVYQNSMGGSGGTSLPPQASLSPTSSPASSPSASLKRTDLVVQVLNGTETAGYAAEAKAYLEELGYEEVAVGNAETTDFEETTIEVKDEMKDYAQLLKNDLSGKYVVGLTLGVLDAESEYDAVVTLGTKTPEQ